ncbi:MAG: prolyl-tRNA synthetase associated domain-containing protein [Vicinamibacterales bacterium]
MSAGADVEQYLAALDIPFVRHEHPAVATVAEAEVHWAAIDALHCKNLFLRNQKGTRHFLVVLSTARRGDLAALGEHFGERKLGFASPERLQRHLGLAPGSVSPFGLINDRDRRVEVAIDVAVRDAARVAFHPNVNTATLVLAGADFQRYLVAVGHEVSWI